MINTTKLLNKMDTNINKDFNNAVDEVWSGKNLRPQGAVIKLDKIPKEFGEIGISNLPVVMNYSKLFTIKKLHNLTPAALKQIPQQLQDPTMIFKNNRENMPTKSFVILTEVEDTKNKPVIVALHVNRFNQKIKVNQIASIHGRNISQIENALKHNELVYRHKQKSQLIMSRLQLPSSLLTDSVGIITNKNIKNNTNKFKKVQSLAKLRAKSKSQGRSR